MIIIERILNKLEIDKEILYEYFKSLEEGECPCIQSLTEYLNEFYYISDFSVDGGTELDYYGDNNELLEYYTEYLND